MIKPKAHATAVVPANGLHRTTRQLATAHTSASSGPPRYGEFAPWLGSSKGDNLD